MEESLGRTAQLVASLRTLLRPDEEPIDVEYRTVTDTTVFGIGAKVGKGEIESWCGEAFPRLYEALAATRTDPAGPGAACYGEDFFSEDWVTCSPTSRSPSLAPDRERRGDGRRLPAGRFAVAVHRGGYHDIDRTYGRLGSHVAAERRRPAVADQGALPDRPEPHRGQQRVPHRGLVADPPDRNRPDFHRPDYHGVDIARQPTSSLEA